MAARGSNAKRRSKRRRHAKARQAATEMQLIDRTCASRRLAEASRRTHEHTAPDFLRMSVVRVD